MVAKLLQFIKYFIYSIRLLKEQSVIGSSQGKCDFNLQVTSSRLRNIK